MNLNLRYISLYMLLLLLYRNIAIVISVFWSEEWIQLGRIWVSNGGLFCARSDGGWRNLLRKPPYDGYDFDMLDYTDNHCVSLYVSQKSVVSKND